ncbi:MAG: hypothetical protein ACKVVP_13775 [Chloroflexota bacterium]
MSAQARPSLFAMGRGVFLQVSRTVVILCVAAMIVGATIALMRGPLATSRQPTRTPAVTARSVATPVPTRQSDRRVAQAQERADARNQPLPERGYPTVLRSAGQLLGIGLVLAVILTIRTRVRTRMRLSRVSRALSAVRSGAAEA